MNKKSVWTWEKNTLDPGRVARAAKVKVVELEITDDECSGIFIGSEGTIYHATLQDCDCPDFAVKHGSIPCKHILRLAMEAGIINQNGNTPEQQKKADIDSLSNKLATAFGFYHLFGKTIMPNEEYDRIKEDLIGMGVFIKPLISVAMEEAKKYLIIHNLSFVDKTNSGGCLYFFDEQTADYFKQNGYKVLFAPSGTKNTDGKPAWYIPFK